MTLSPQILQPGTHVRAVQSHRTDSDMTSGAPDLITFASLSLSIRYLVRSCRRTTWSLSHGRGLPAADAARALMAIRAARARAMGMGLGPL